MTATSTKRQDFLGRWLVNANPGTSTNVTDYLSRNIASGTTDYLGRLLTFDHPAAWQTGHGYSAGEYVRPASGTNYDLVAIASDAGTSDGSTEPIWATTVGGTVVDNAGVNSITWTTVHG